MAEIGWLIFDVEAVADGDLIARVCYPKETLTPAEAIARKRAELLEERGSDFIPYTFMLPISVAIAKVRSDASLEDVVLLDEPDYRPSVITANFWNGWRHYRRPTFVTFNGRGYDLPLMEISAYRYGLSLPDWFNVEAKSFEQSRNRYNISRHFDLMDLMSNFGAARVTGGLNVLSNIIGKPGKTGIDGSQVQDMYDAGGVQEINDYCVCDVLDTYFVFLRSRVLTGHLSLEQEQQRVAQAKELLEKNQDRAAFAHYLKHWGDWQAPEPE
ncbi:3'-5' exonuclease [bacterium]|uniref:3'-5' exonuclease, PolB n=1 Tax=Rubinisphaera brasiliensis (strain ATCC 49424 / DSM 5305 / JCM 21570 / IAM 15109 / NBRC 103401 / IFAM 1448) TaxID=756272 RepID=F0SHH3_RUBBR|nr:3'-5' exonuclease [Rubinisphaera brasiliensis]ADY58411.1 3'-5' exonuclease, PolB [Rubinisphaera brasiliensis DSM 5305]MBR9803805.1 3'-5' exonuclease [bacterium]